MLFKSSHRLLWSGRSGVSGCISCSLAERCGVSTRALVALLALVSGTFPFPFPFGRDLPLLDRWEFSLNELALVNLTASDAESLESAFLASSRTSESAVWKSIGEASPSVIG